MPTVAAGSTATYTLPTTQQITLTFEQGERSEWEVRRAGRVVAGGSSTTTRTIGPFLGSDVLVITASRGAVDYEAIAYIPTNDDDGPATLSGVTYDGSSRVTGYVKDGVSHVVTYPSATQIIDTSAVETVTITLDGAGRPTDVVVV